MDIRNSPRPLAIEEVLIVKVWNVAVVGAGIGRGHIGEGYNALPDKFRVLALCDIDPRRLHTVSGEFGIPCATVSFGELLAMPDLDIIDICTPPALHLEQSLAALMAGKHVICEKPLVGSLADADRLIAAEQAATGRLMPVFQYRFGNGLQKARHIIASGIAGKPYLATVETAWTRRPAYYNAVPWRGKYETELGGALVSHAIHAHDLLTYLMGPVASVFARIDTRVNAVEVEDTAVASLVLQSGALASLSVTLGSAREISRLRLYFEHVTFESALSPYAPGDPWQILPTSARAADAIDQALADWRLVRPNYVGLFAACHTALETGGPLPVTLAEARASLELITALYHSSATGQNVDLPILKDHPRYRSWRPN
jgi:predicted dehydrogenase